VSTYLNSQLAFYGNAQDAVAAATTSASNMVTQLQTQISGLQDADETQSILQLTQAQTEQQAALQSFQQIPGRLCSISWGNRGADRSCWSRLRKQTEPRPQERLLFTQR